MVLIIALNVIFILLVVVGMLMLLGGSIRAGQVHDAALAEGRRVRRTRPARRRAGRLVPRAEW